MKKLLSLALILSTTTIIASCSEKSDGRRPDAVYQRTIGNPELGGSSSINEMDSPISDSIGTSRIFSSHKSSEKPAQKKTKLIVPAEPAKVEKEQIKQDFSASAASRQEKAEAIVASATEPAPEPAKEEVVTQVEAEEEATSQPSAVAPEVKESNLNILEMRPVSPDENVQVISVSKDGVPQNIAPEQYIRAEVPQQVEAPKQEVVEAPKAAEPVAIQAEAEHTEETAPIAPVKKNGMNTPASMVYKQQRTTAPDVKKVEEDKPTVIEKVASIFSSDDEDKKENKKHNAHVAPVAASELPAPEGANIGECMAKVTTPGEYKEVEEQVLVRDATTRTVNSPAEYQEVEEHVVITPEKQEEIIIPAVYKDVSENVLVTPGQKSWKKVDNKGDVLQLVEEKPVYKNVVKKELVREEQRETKTTPAVTKTVKKKVLVKEAATNTVDVPAVYKTVKKRVAVSPDKIEWQTAICENKLDKDTTKRIQGALITKGYDIRIVDGTLGSVTRKALFDYQRSLGVDSPAILLKTIDSLGLSN